MDYSIQNLVPSYDFIIHLLLLKNFSLFPLPSNKFHNQYLNRFFDMLYTWNEANVAIFLLIMVLFS